MTQDKINRINALSRAAREGELTPAEQEERAALRQEFIADYRRNMKAQLDNIVLADECGGQRPPKQKKR